MKVKEEKSLVSWATHSKAIRHLLIFNPKWATNSIESERGCIKRFF
jgi:hypothetical protein